MWILTNISTTILSIHSNDDIWYITLTKIISDCIMSYYMKYIVLCNAKSYQTYCVMSNNTKSNMLHYTILIHINCIAFCYITLCCMICIMSCKHTLYHVTSISYHMYIYIYSSSFFKYTKFLKHQQKSWHSFLCLARYFSQEFSNLGEAIWKGSGGGRDPLGCKGHTVVDDNQKSGYIKNRGTQQPCGFPTRNDHFGVFWGVPPFKETPI